jgi:3-hydroxyisobutyrate dehydrogenase-like beta-hydroxyacid dehydrogenase
MTCGVLGVGAIGRGFVTSLIRAGFEVAVHDVSAEATAAAEALGASSASSPASLAATSDVLLVAVPDTLEILTAAALLEDALRPGTLVLVMSTVAPATPVELGRRLEPRDVTVLDCPVSGGPDRAEAGELAVMVGGSEEGFRRARPVLDALGSQVVHVGPLGHGEIAKLANNLMGAAIVLGIAEGLALAAKAGADVERVCEAVAGGSGSSWILREWIPRTVLAGDYERRFSLDLMCKDMRLIDDLARELGVPIPAGALARETFERAVAAGYGGDDFSRAVALHAEAAGAPLPRLS